MRVRIPANHRQSFRWVGDLDAPALFVLCVGGAIAVHVLPGTAPVAVKISEMVVSGGLGILFAFGRWPMERGGDRMWTWMRRLVTFLSRPRRGSSFGRSVSPDRLQRPRLFFRE